jgi:hypothetical protein
MAVPAGTRTTYANGGMVGLREDLSDVIYNISPMDTICLTRFEKMSASAKLHEWQTDSLAAAAANAALEGDDFSAVTGANTIRLGNRLQISKKEVVVSGTAEAVDKAGREREMTYQMMKRAKELKRDIEFAMLSTNSATAGALASARVSASIQAFLETSLHIYAAANTTATTTAYSSGGIPTSDAVNGSATAFVSSLLDTALLQAWTNGGETNLILTSAAVKNTMNAFTGIATRFRDVGSRQQAQIINAADIYVSNYGSHPITISRYVTASTVLCLDTNYWGIAFLPGRQFKTIDISKTGDNEKKMVVAEWTLVGKCPQSSVKITGVT